MTDTNLGASYRLQYRRPVHFVRGEGMWLYDPDGIIGAAADDVPTREERFFLS